MLRYTALLLLLLVNGIDGDKPRSADPGTTGELAGLWQARRRFGPDIRGPLVVQRRFADVAGHRLPVQWKGDTITFELPDGEGSFRGYVTPGRRIEGHWTQPVMVNTGGRVASPVTLRAGGDAGTRGRGEQWSGRIDPLDDVFTFYLKIEP